MEHATGCGEAVRCRIDAASGGQIHGQHQPYGRQWRLEVFEGTGLEEINEDPAQAMVGLEAAGLEGMAQPFQWKFTRADLSRLMANMRAHMAMGPENMAA